MISEFLKNVIGKRKNITKQKEEKKEIESVIVGKIVNNENFLKEQSENFETVYKKLCILYEYGYFVNNLFEIGNLTVKSKFEKYDSFSHNLFFEITNDGISYSLNGFLDEHNSYHEYNADDKYLLHKIEIKLGDAGYISFKKICNMINEKQKIKLNELISKTKESIVSIDTIFKYEERKIIESMINNPIFKSDLCEGIEQSDLDIGRKIKQIIKNAEAIKYYSDNESDIVVINAKNNSSLSLSEFILEKEFEHFSFLVEQKNEYTGLEKNIFISFPKQPNQKSCTKLGVSSVLHYLKEKSPETFNYVANKMFVLDKMLEEIKNLQNLKKEEETRICEKNQKKQENILNEELIKVLGM